MSITKQKLEFIVDEVFKMNTQEEISISFTENLEIKDLKIMFLNDIYNLESKSKIVMSSDLKKLNKVIDNAITGICDILQNYKNLLSKYIDKNHKILVKHFIVECIVFKRHLEERDENIKELINNTAIIIKDDLNKIIKDYEYKFIKQMLN
ncbi:hypothetical protein NAPIS_ORF00370 [Vairimorpha apis BRL 01]|uniref:Uncharacterized protein n=1 Tax=Vairimorpha apis BRL 01 TaxID=1037528 RepID=T0MM20_9MICR|nr:hypothetical protein NAPIS_ORF00370 [Vairimorpha apis BRL 01]